MDQGVHYETRMGAPQGSPLSPLLLNISLDGLEEVLGVKWYQGSRSTYRAPSNPYAPIRYADDAVILTDSKAKAEAAKNVLEPWLAARGLSLSQEKTRIVHLSEGFDFLGFNCRLFPSKRKRSGQVLHIKPSKTSIQRLKARLRQEWLMLKGHNALSVIRKLNPIIRAGRITFVIALPRKPSVSLMLLCFVVRVAMPITLILKSLANGGKRVTSRLIIKRVLMTAGFLGIKPKAFTSGNSAGLKYNGMSKSKA